MSGYNEDKEYIEGLLLSMNYDNADFHRANISSGSITLSGNRFDDITELLRLERTPAQNFSQEPVIPPSGNFQGYEMGESTASWATPSHTGHWSREENRIEVNEDVELSPFEGEVIRAARQIAHHRDNRLFGKPRRTDEHMVIFDEFELSIVDFFQGEDEESAYDEGSGGMTIDNRYNLLRVVRHSMRYRYYEASCENPRQAVTRGQELLINKIRRIRERKGGDGDIPQ
ncbi:uncharacterized protein TRUGW13939_06520 [Talaromyces rugulosus]|uniref:Uncharacterized protein n=1 Tax=Talaromyces rugulosus TaxID=121627 RepID=A0A7H8R049_TALRU|nr:uncharacterized protein TRUGW13939_06520 [Talaromyces rugulosus]QKX59386.1 hypothetical protein TRUGW13939_06520 [Talaromyces rugulosus]